MKSIQLKLFIILFAIGVNSSLYGQDKDKNTSPDIFRKLQIGINFSPDYAYRTLKLMDTSALGTFVLNNRNDRETAKFGYTLGLNLIYNFNKTIGIETGVQFSDKGYQFKIKGEDLIFGDQIDPRHGFVYNDSTSPTIKSMKVADHFYYLDIPLKVNFSIGKGKVRFISSAGIITNILIVEKGSTVIHSSDGKTTRHSGKNTLDKFNTITLSPTISLGIDWKISNRQHIKIEPTFRYGVLKIINTSLTGYLWNVGLNFSYYFGIK